MDQGPHARGPWWRGQRGEWLVVLQVCLMLLVAAGPRTIGGWPARPFPFPEIAWRAGLVLLLAGSALFLAGIRTLGPSLTALPHPKEDAVFTRSGLYAIVRHPIYSAVLLLCVGWSLARQSWLTLAYTFVLFVFFEVKTRREERWLTQRFPEYAAYRRHVRKFVPFVY